MAHHDAAPLVVRKTFEASPPDLFAAWTEPALMKRWFHMGHDWSTPSAAADVRPDGEYSVEMRTPRGDVLRYEGWYLAVDFPRQLAMIWPAYGRPDLPTRLRVEFTTTPTGATELTLTQTGLPDEEARADHLSGWSTTLAQLEAAFASGMMRGK